MLSRAWKNLLEPEFAKPYFLQLKDFLQQEYAENTVFPSKKLIFNAFYLCPFEQLKVVVLGQDPYHNIGQAHGLSFSVPDGIAAPPSLQNIFKEIDTDFYPMIQEKLIFSHGDLSFWATQGVLLLNATLTVAGHKAGSHQNKGWECFTDYVIQTLSTACENLVFLLWGKYALQKKNLIDAQKHLILTAPHPSPLSAHRGFFGQSHFSRTNQYLQGKGKSPIFWHPKLQKYYESLCTTH